MARNRATQQPLHGRVAAITGAARGIGKATAAAFIREGISVAIGDLDGELAESAARELGHGTIALTLDVTERTSVAAFLDESEERLGPLDVVVNNAGIMLIGRPTWEEDDSASQRQIEINVNGVLYGIKEAIPRFRARGHGHGHGHIVNIASGAGKLGFAAGGTYCGTKHFVVGISEALRAELHGSGIEVSCVMPAVVNTELASGHKPVLGLRTVEPEDVANAIVNALRRPRFDVHVPAELGALTRAHGILPRRAFEALMRATKADAVLTSVDTADRAAYEQRATEESGTSVPRS